MRFELADGRRVLASHGAIVGRLASATVHINDPGISEAHALVSLRAGTFRLIALRGQLAVDGALVKEATLAPERVVHLTPGHTLRVVHLHLPRAVLAIEGAGLVRQALPPAASFTARPLAMASGFRPDAVAWIWTDGIEWNLRSGDAAGRPLRAGDTFEIDGQQLRTSMLALDDAGGATTLGPALDLEPLVIETNYDVVRVRRGDQEALTLTGQSARLVSELVLLGGSAPWEVLAKELWRETDRNLLRSRFDICLLRLRKRLKRARLRPDLVRPLGNGVIELVLHSSDRVVDRC